ncbi:MAG TPA: MFS transporter [Syntrophomonadaceae bacterium]|nr:MFS transporter [Syntrophomonadaceae bacterium]HQE23433.1 MFS transporter [Syntrophomonadaceae bacterium]
MPGILIKRIPYRYLVVSFLFLIWIAVYLQRVNIGILIVDERFLSDLGLIGQSAQQGLLMTLFLIPYAFSNVIGAPIGDLLGPRKAMLLGLLIAALAMFMGALAASFAVMLSSRVILGIGQGIHYPTQSIIVNNWFPVEERGKANAVYGVGCIGPLLAVPLFTYLISHCGWEYILYLSGGLGLIVLIPLANKMVTDYPHQNTFITKNEQHYLQESVPRSSNKSLLAGGMKDIKPILKSTQFWLITVAYSAYLSIWWGIATWVPQYLNIARGFSLESLGWVASIPYGAAALGVAFGGVMSDKLSRRSVFGVVGLAGASLCILLSAVVPSNALSAALVVSAPVFNQMLYAPLWTIVQSTFPSHLMGTGTGLVNGIANLVSALAPVIIGLLIQLSGSYGIGLMYLTAFGLLGSLCSLLMMRQGV